jgi:transposase InsO family protein
MDFVGPMPVNKGKRYVVTIFDRATRYFQAYPKASPTAVAAVEALTTWVSLFGVPQTVITDQGTHFEARLFQEATTRLGIEKRRTTSYHPASNGAVERQHRRLKASLRCKIKSQKDWVNDLPLILLGLNNAVSEDTGTSASQAVYGRLLDIPNCVFEHQVPMTPAAPYRNYQRTNAHLPRALLRCKYVWVRRKSKTSLQQPYRGPYKVLQRNFDNNTFQIQDEHKQKWINLQRLKPAIGYT